MNEKNSIALRRRVLEISKNVECDPYRFDVVLRDGGEIAIEARLWRQDTDTGEWGWGQGGQHLIDEMMSDDVIAKRFLVAALSYAEHEVREGFRYKGRRIFGPHMPLQALWEAAEEDVRV